LKVLRDEIASHEKPSNALLFQEKFDKIEKAISRIQIAPAVVNNNPPPPPPPAAPEKIIWKEHVQIKPQPSSENVAQSFCMLKSRPLIFSFKWKGRCF
jgi:hypothetical protein